MNLISQIARTNRRMGSTTWILKAAINNPNCVIVSQNPRYLEDMYYRLFYNIPWYKMLYWKMFVKKHPKFYSKIDDFSGISLPVIFDNSALE